jgi:hypothetical protein
MNFLQTVLLAARVASMLLNMHLRCYRRCPHYAQKRTSGLAFSASALCPWADIEL